MIIQQNKIFYIYTLIIIQMFLVLIDFKLNSIVLKVIELIIILILFFIITYCYYKKYNKEEILTEFTNQGQTISKWSFTGMDDIYKYEIIVNAKHNTDQTKDIINKFFPSKYDNKFFLMFK
jgi:hypothetical protein